MWSENGQVNGNGQPMYGADAFFNPATNQWSDRLSLRHLRGAGSGRGRFPAEMSAALL